MLLLPLSFPAGGARKLLEQFRGERPNVFESVCARVNEEHGNSELRQILLRRELSIHRNESSALQPPININQHRSDLQRAPTSYIKPQTSNVEPRPRR